jgi:hypothetical protein
MNVAGLFRIVFRQFEEIPMAITFNRIYNSSEPWEHFQEIGTGV